jgi:transcriptional regulator with XRE-family HTH domain
MTALDILDILESQGLTVKDIVTLSGVSQPTISMIKSGQRSGKTSIPTLQRLLDSTETRQHTYTPSVIEGTISSVDGVPVKQSRMSTSRSLQPYGTDIPFQERQERGIAYRQNRNRYGVTPDAMMEEIQGLRLQLNDMVGVARYGKVLHGRAWYGAAR